MPTTLRAFWLQTKPLAIFVLALTLAGGTYHLMSPLETTRVRLSVRAEAIAWDSADSTVEDPQWFGWNLRGSVGSTYSQFPAAIITDPTGASLDDRAQLDLAPRSTPDTLHLEKLAYPPLTHLSLNQDSPELRLTMSADTPYNATPLQWEVLFRHRDYLRPESDSTISLDRRDIPFRLPMRKHLRPGHEYTLALTRPLPWKSPGRVMARAVRFELTNASKTAIVSSVLGGTVELLDTKDSPILLTERDIVKLEFARPAELFLSGDGHNVEVHFDGVVSSVKCGPKIMGDNNERMPLHIQSIHDKRPYVAALLIPLLVALVGWVNSWSGQSQEVKTKRKKKKSKKSRPSTSTLLVLLLLSAMPAVGQPGAPWQHYAGCLVRLRAVDGTKDEYGSGFVVGTTVDSVFIATAGHVLIQPTATVEVWLDGQRRPLPARVLYIHNLSENGPDIGLVAVAARGYHTPLPAFATDLTPNDELWFVHSELADDSAIDAGLVKLSRTRMPRLGSGILSSLSSQSHTLIFLLNGVEQGDSGSALFTTVHGKPVLVGMITERNKPNVAHDMDFVATTLRLQLGHRWLLTQLPPRTDD